MSRLVESTICIPNDVKMIIKDRVVLVQGNLGLLTHFLHNILDCKIIDKNCILSFRSKNRLVNNRSLLGTTYALLRAMIFGVSFGFIKKLQLVGVGYRVAINDNIITLMVGFSHVVNYKVPDGIIATCPSLVDIVLRSANKQLLGQFAANLRAIRPPEPFSGKGIRYEGEIVHIKDIKKK
ncbi:50S ribosomal protein L6 [Blochmannia endosymbiont of Polyrhachis (Hedomyrma) turneri]|uniref:50S ribosomal protein L6 n=1 Tax=Blochmannia endosymbiont of Polyrhachis (Hedomyrma) turneri TaxID=1505596 RepID=UPI00061A52CA|nr:50S ribosomal protein L6 [Blochmannia endosymbiont of Polyrhachis (Hedomyrma) turneri]AKC59784.1 50S ribosomal protein L6 [Blochmannia endosymbiont of Polyrhachis (Hedomyrma) turneri]